MKIKVNNYTFNKTAKTVTFNDYTSIRLDGVLLITNVTRNIIIYNFASPALGGSLIGNVLTLTYDTSAMNNTDSLQIFYEDEDTNASTDESILLLRRIVKQLEASDTKDFKNRQKVIIDGIGNVTGNPTDANAYIMVGIQAGAATNMGNYQASLQPIKNPSSAPYTEAGAYTLYTYEGPVEQRWRVAEDSHISYQLGIRNKLSFT